MAYLIQEKPLGSGEGMVLRGAVRKLWSYKGQEAIVSGPAETGKTMGTLAKVNALLWKYPGCQGVVARKTYKSMQGSVLQSYEKKILGDTFGKIVKAYGGEKPEWYDYPNGSRLWVGGFDNPDKILSSERDFFYMNQVEEMELKDWEYAITRATGRAGNMPYAQVFGDCNPGPSSHWIKQRFGTNLLESRHEDNPTLFDDYGNILEQGVRSLAALDALTGVRLQRLRYGKWVSAEGVIFENFDMAKHAKMTRAEVPRCDRFIEVVDFGYTHPFVWQRWAIDDDGRIYVTHEIYFTQRIVEDHCKQINAVTAGMPRPEAIICDHDAEDRATFERHRRMRTIAADKSVRPGIEDVQNRLKIPGDGRSRFNVCTDALVEVDQKLKDEYKPTKSLDEVELYIWNADKDAPVKDNDHGMDDWRYGCRYLDRKRVPSRRTGSMSFGSV